MIRIEIFCDDKKLGEIVKHLSGLLLQPPNIQYVANAKAKGGKVIAKEEAGNMVELATAFVRSLDAKQVSISDLKEWLRTQGFAEGSAVYLGVNLRKAKVLRLIPNRRGTYAIVPVKK